MNQINSNNKALTEAQGDFALQLLRQTQLNGIKSSILSPISIGLSMAIIYNGADGNTAKQNADVIARGCSKEILNEYFSSLFKVLQDNEKSQSVLKAVNHLYAEKSFNIKETFLNIIQQYYEGEFEQVDFKNNFKEEKKRINKFIEANTENYIKNMLEEGMIDSNTRLLIINAMFFAGKWKNRFQHYHPYQEPESFFVSENVTREVLMMNSLQKVKYRYENAEGYDVVGIDYQDNYTMFILLPKEKFGLAAMIQNLNGITLTKHAKNKKTKICKVEMPRFTFNLKLNLVKMLENIGITEAFNPDAANFSYLTTSENVFIDNALHQGFIQVDEKGTKMAAATAVRAAPCTGGPPPPPKLLFRADHPFLYFVANENANIIFIGTVVDNFQ